MQPTPRRNIGPYITSDQAMEQYRLTTGSLRHVTDQVGCVTVLKEALHDVGLRSSGWLGRMPDLEENTIIHLSYTIRPDTVQIIAGWIIRAHQIGHERESVAKVTRYMSRSAIPLEPIPHGAGPYHSSAHLLPQGLDQATCVMLLEGALRLVGLRSDDPASMPELEQITIIELGTIIRPCVAQIIAGWIDRAYQAGRRHEREQGAHHDHQ